MYRGEIEIDNIPLRSYGIEVDTQQILLKYNLIRFLENNDYHPNEDWYAKLDRIRRARNELVHQAKTQYNIEFLSEFLSKISRLYLKELFRKSGLSTLTNDEVIHK